MVERSKTSNEDRENGVQEREGIVESPLEDRVEGQGGHPLDTPLSCPRTPPRTPPCPVRGLADGAG